MAHCHVTGFTQREIRVFFLKTCTNRVLNGDYFKENESRVQRRASDEIAPAPSICVFEKILLQTANASLGLALSCQGLGLWAHHPKPWFFFCNRGRWATESEARCERSPVQADTQARQVGGHSLVPSVALKVLFTNSLIEAL